MAKRIPIHLNDEGTARKLEKPESGYIRATWPTEFL